MKESLRNIMKEQRTELSPKDKKNLDKKINSRLFRVMPFKRAKTVFLYISKQEEIDTWEILRYLLKEKRKVVVPKVVRGKSHLHLVELKDIEHLEEGSFGVHEPRSPHTKVNPEKIDAAIVPGLAFDKKGNRLGYGMGYFDRTLKLLKCPIIALAYDFQVVDKIPRDLYDVPVDFIVTPTKLYERAYDR